MFPSSSSFGKPNSNDVLPTTTTSEAPPSSSSSPAPDPTSSSSDPTDPLTPQNTRPGPTRTRSSPGLQPESTGSSPSTDATLPPPVTAPAASRMTGSRPISPARLAAGRLNDTGDSGLSGGRHRAHTVSVSFKPQTASRLRNEMGQTTEGRRASGPSSPMAQSDSARRGSASRRRPSSAVSPRSKPESPKQGDGESGAVSDGKAGEGEGKVNGRKRGVSIANSVRESIQDRLRRGSLEDARMSAGTPVSVELEGEHHDLHDEVVGVLDVIDPHVSTANHLQNMSNSLMVPHFPQLWSRRPEVILPDTPSETQPLVAPDDRAAAQRATRRHRASTVSRLFPPSSSISPSGMPNTAPFAPIPETGVSPTSPGGPKTAQSAPPATTSKTSAPGDSPVKPPTYGRSSSYDVDEDEADEGEHDSDVASSIDEIDREVTQDHLLDAHVRHVLLSQSRKETLKRIGRGTWTFLKTPQGIITAIYGFLVAFWGAAIVLFLLGWIHTGSKYRQDVWVEISSQVENGLFTLTGIGLIPWRVIDTYRMARIWHLKVETQKRRAAKGLPPIEDPNDLPDPKDVADYISVLTDKEQEELQYQQMKYSKSQTWYRPHATATHRAFPIKWALWNTLLMDGNSFFQCFLCGCMWGLSWHVRPAWTTGCLIPLSFLCGIGAVVLIWQGSKRTKKTEAVEEKLREALDLPLDQNISTTRDGTVITSDNQAPMPSSTNGVSATGKKRPSVDHETGKEGKHGWHLFGKKNSTDIEKGEGASDDSGSKETRSHPNPKHQTNSNPLHNPAEPVLKRRATVTEGHISNPAVEEMARAAAEGEKDGRARGVTVAAPQVSDRGTTSTGVQPGGETASQVNRSIGGEADLEKVKSEPLVK